MLKSKNLISITLLVIAAGAAGFLILRSMGFLRTSEPAPEEVLTQNIVSQPPEESEKFKEAKGRPLSQSSEDLEREARLKSQMPDLSKLLVITANLPEETRNKATKDINDTIKLIKSNYDYLQAWLQLGILRKFIGDFEGARDAWEFASVLRPKNAISFNNLGELYGFYLKDFPKADRNYLKSIENDPKNVDAYKSLADIYQYSYTEKKDQVDDVLLKGLSNNPNRIDLMIMLARYYVDTGNLTAAVAYYQNILKIDPNDKNAKEELAQLKF